MRVKLAILGILVLVVVAAALYLRYGGVTHERIYDAVTDESERIQSKIDERYQALDQKLDRIEGKLDRILELANRPLPDKMQPVR